MRSHQVHGFDDHGPEREPSVAPGKRTLTSSIQRRAAAEPLDAAPAGAPVVARATPAGASADPYWFCDAGTIESAAARGVDTPASPLPHAERIAESFGRHATDDITAHTGAAAADSAREMGAMAYATGNHVVLGDTSLHTVAHEAAHVIQQRAGVHAKTGEDDHGDRWERHADDVADAVVRGESAVQLLDQVQPPGARTLDAAPAVQRMKLNNEGNYSPLFGDHDTSDRAGFAAWIDQLEQANNRALLDTILGSLHRDVFDLADHEAIALSLVRRALDRLNDAAHPTAAPAAGAQGQMDNLPREDRWKLFIEGDKHDQPTDDANAMRFDNDQSPGYYAAMQRAFDRNVPSAPTGQQLDFDAYNAMHVDCTRDILRNDGDGGFEPVPHVLSARNVQFPMTQNEFPNPRALEELHGEGMLGLQPRVQQVMGPMFGGLDPAGQGAVANVNNVIGDAHEAGNMTPTQGRRVPMLLMLGSIFEHQGADNAYSSMLHPMHVVPTDEMQLSVTTNRDQAQARGEVDALFATYYGRLAAIDANLVLAAPGRRQQKLAAIARLVRALHVGHYFHDANGRLNTMVLLDRLLVDAGFAPVIMQRTDIFGGAYTADELVAAIEVGLQAFQAAIAAAHPAPAPVIPLVIADADADAGGGAEAAL